MIELAPLGLLLKLTIFFIMLLFVEYILELVEYIYESIYFFQQSISDPLGPAAYAQLCLCCKGTAPACKPDQVRS